MKTSVGIGLVAVTALTGFVIYGCGKTGGYPPGGGPLSIPPVSGQITSPLAANFDFHLFGIVNEAYAAPAGLSISMATLGNTSSTAGSFSWTGKSAGLCQTANLLRFATERAGYIDYDFMMYKHFATNPDIMSSSRDFYDGRFFYVRLKSTDYGMDGGLNKMRIITNDDKSFKRFDLYTCVSGAAKYYIYREKTGDGRYYGKETNGQSGNRVEFDLKLGQGESIVSRHVEVKINSGVLGATVPHYIIMNQGSDAVTISHLYENGGAKKTYAKFGYNDGNTDAASYSNQNLYITGGTFRDDTGTIKGWGDDFNASGSSQYRSDVNGFTETASFFTTAGFDAGESWDCQVPAGETMYDVDLSRATVDSLNDQYRRLTIDNPVADKYIGPSNIDCTGTI